MTVDTEQRVREAWSGGSYQRFARTYLGMAADLVEATGIEPDDATLDVACGSGNVAITAARRGARVTGLDITPEMLEMARENAEVAGVENLTWREGDATDLPFGADSFDATCSALGHMYAQPADAAAEELLRVTRTGGRIGFTAWTPSGLYPVLGGLVLTQLPREERPEFDDPPFMWGDSDVVRARLDRHVSNISFERDTIAHPAMSPGHFWRDLATHSGTFRRFLDSVHDRDSLREEAIDTIAPYFDDDLNAVELEYLRTTATVADPG